jgi:predicted MFS family arabinose efflux permease
VAGWLFSIVWLRFFDGRIEHALVFSALTSVGLGLYSLTLPAGPKDAPRRRRLFPDAALRVFRSPAIVGTAIAGFFMQLVDKYYYFGTAPFLRDIGFPDSHIMPIMTIGQITEVVFLALLGGIIARIGFRRALMLGALMEVLRFFCFTLVGWKYLAVAGILFHGPAFALFFTTAFIFIDTFTDTESRAGVQQLFSVLSIGIGNFAGSILAGFVYDLSTAASTAGGAGAAGGAGGSGAGGAAEAAAGTVVYTNFWMVPLVISALVAAGIGIVGLVRSRR